MSALRPCLIFVIALCCYAFCGSSNAIRHESEKTRAAAVAEKAQENKININSDSYHESSKPHFQLQPATTTTVLQRKEIRQKRSQYDFLNDYSNSNNNLNELNDDDDDDDEDNEISQTAKPTMTTMDRGDFNLDLDDLPPYTYFLLLQKLRQLQSHEPTYRVRTPRLGRSIDLQLLNGIGGGNRGLSGRNYDIDGKMTRQSKKSVPFKPRLGKRTKFNCN